MKFGMLVRTGAGPLRSR